MQFSPWSVDGDVDYERVTSEFGVTPIDDNVLIRFEKIIGRPAHPFLRRGIFFAHRDLEKILDWHEEGKPWYIYTGRGPSSEALHLGHLIPLLFAQYLQETFGVHVVIQLTDDEKILWRNLSISQVKAFTKQNACDIIACGFDPNITFMFSNLGYMGGAFYENIVKVQRTVTLNQACGTFGFTGASSIGQVAFPAVQIAPAMASTFPHIFGDLKQIRCLIQCAVDQDPYFRIARDVLPRLGYFKPSLIESRFFPSLKGSSGKMGASDPTTAIYVTDTPTQIKNKINRYAFSGGGATIEEHRLQGANLSVDVSWSWLNFFLWDDTKLEKIGQEYKTGRMLTGEVKQELIQVLSDLVKKHQTARAAVSDEVLQRYTYLPDGQNAL